MSKLEICNRKFITNKDRLIVGKDLVYLSGGCNAKVYKGDFADGTKAVKIFKKTNSCFNLNWQSYEAMKDLDLKRTLNPQETLYSPGYSEQERIEGYVMKFLDEDRKMDFLHFPSNKLLESFSLMEEDAILLGENLVRMNDVSSDNVICTKNKEIWVSDPNFFKLGQSDMVEGNKILVGRLCRDLMLNAIYDSGDFSEQEKIKLREDLKVYFDPWRDKINKFVRMFENTDKPIEYFKKRLR